MFKSESTRVSKTTILGWLIWCLIALVILVVVLSIAVSCVSMPEKTALLADEQCKDGIIYAWKSDGAVGEGWYIKFSPEGKIIECTGWK